MNPHAGRQPRLWTADIAALPAVFAEQGFVAVPPATLCALAGVAPDELAALAPSWGRLPPDRWLRDGGSYRHRRHDSYVLAGGTLERVAHRAHFQPVEYNALHGGLQRWFEPVEPATAAAPAWSRLVVALGQFFASVAPAPAAAAPADGPWFVEAHQFRIDTAGGIGRPTPEGAHRDGVDFVAVVLVDRQRVRGGETRVFDAAGPAGVRFVIEAPWSALLLDDVRVIHETTPIQPAGDGGWRDTLVLTYRRGGFLGP